MVYRIAVLLVALLSAAAGVRTDASAQSSGKVYRVGWVHVAAAPPAPGAGTAHVGALPPLHVFRARLADRGYTEGTNLVISERWAGGDYQRVVEMASELSRSRVDVIFTAGTKTARILQDVVRTTPLVVYSCDPFEHVARLARQGGNVTGVTCMSTELSGKRLELLKEAVPAASRIVFFSDLHDAPAGLKIAQEAAMRLGVRLPTVGFANAAGIPNALDAVAKERPDALYIYPDPIANAERRQIAEFALKHRLPSMHAFREYADAGGLMSYGANSADMFRHMADQVALVLDGAKPGDIPVRQATRFELVINLRTAKALGVTMPPSLLLRADQLLE